MRLISCIIVLLVGITAAGAHAETDVFYPAGHSLSASYEISQITMTASDTLVLTRSLVNGESYSLTSLYFADNLPAAFSVISYSLTRNGDAIGCGFSGANTDTVLPGYDAYQWVVDWPDAFGGLQTEIISGDSLHLQVMITCNEAGSYSLPLHTIVCCGNGGQMFAVPLASVFITVEASVDLTPPGRIEDLDAQPGDNIGSIGMIWTAPADDGSEIVSGREPNVLDRQTTLAALTTWQSAPILFPYFSFVFDPTEFSLGAPELGHRGHFFDR